MSNRVLFVLLSLVIVGCSTTQTKPGAGIPVPAEHIYNAEYLINKPGNESVTFTRDKGWHGSGCSHIIFIDNVKVFDISPSQFITVSLEPGVHLLRLDADQETCRGTYSKETTLVLGQPQIFRISLSISNLELTRIE